MESREDGERVAGQTARSRYTHRYERFRTDYRRRYPVDGERAQSTTTDLAAAGAKERTDDVHLRNVPPEIGILLIVVGTAGVLLPGPVGSPFLLAGGIVLWPKGFRGLERWLTKVAPRLYAAGIRQIERYLLDLESRYPNQ
jgi:hypothetical protein